MSDPHIGFIVAAYSLTAFVLIGLVTATILDGRTQRRALARLEQQGRSGEREP